MIRLVTLEMRRGLARRATRGLLAVALLGIVVIGVSLYVSSKPDFAPAEALAQAESNRAEGLANCARTDGFGEASRHPDLSVVQLCDQLVAPVTEMVRDKRFHLTELWPKGGEGDNILAFTAVFLVIGALVGGATFIGGEWRWGTMTTLLTWEPRRARVFLAKAAAAALLTVVIGIVLQLLVGAIVLPAALVRGTTAGTDAEWFRGLVGAVLRASALGAAAALLGYAVASIGRNTAAALGAAFAYVSVFEALVRGLKPGWQRWLIGDNGAVFMNGRQLRTAEFERTVAEAAIILAVYLAVVLGAAALLFHRRDVT